jgi:hypothetical protein
MVKLKGNFDTEKSGELGEDSCMKAKWT